MFSVVTSGHVACMLLCPLLSSFSSRKRQCCAGGGRGYVFITLYIHINTPNKPTSTSRKTNTFRIHLKHNPSKIHIQKIWNQQKLSLPYLALVTKIFLSFTEVPKKMFLCLCKSSLPIKVYPRLEFKLLLNLLKMIVKTMQK